MHIINRINTGEFDNKVPFTKDNLNDYRQGQRDAKQRFKDAILEEVGLTGHPKADKAFDMAWDRGHSSGYADVYYNLEEFADLLL